VERQGKTKIDEFSAGLEDVDEKKNKTKKKQVTSREGQKGKKERKEASTRLRTATETLIGKKGESG